MVLGRQTNTTIAQAQRRRKDEEPQGRCHQLSGCVSCTRSLRRRQRQTTDHVTPALRCQRDNGGRQAFGPPCRFQLALRHQPRICSKTERLPAVQKRFGVCDHPREAPDFFLRDEDERSCRATFLSFPASAGYPTIASAF